MFASIFPNLQLLYLRYCYDISEVGICQVLKRCCQIRHILFRCKATWNKFWSPQARGVEFVIYKC